MPETTQTFKQVSVRWPEDFWAEAKIAAIRQGTSLTKAMTQGAAQVLGIDPPAEVPEQQESDHAA